MSLPDISLQTRRLDPAEADVRVHCPQPVSGRLVGPRCRYASTIEVAHYLRPMPGGEQRVIIPEPSLWEPESPFYYEAILEVGAPPTSVRRRHGLRSLALTPSGVRINGKPLTLRSKPCDHLDETTAVHWRGAGINTILCPLETETEGLWDLADQLGFFIVGRMEHEDVAIVHRFASHPCAFGLLLDVSTRDAASIQRAGLFRGVRLTGANHIPSWAHFTLSAEGHITETRHA